MEKIVALAIVTTVTLISCESPTIKSQVGSNYLSAREMKIELEKVGYSFNNPVELDDQIRLTEVSHVRGRTTNIFYRNDSVREATVVLNIEYDRDALEKNFDKFSQFTDVIDTAATSWVKGLLISHDVKKDIETEKVIGNKKYSVGYYPDVSKDVLRITMYNNTEK